MIEEVAQVANYGVLGTATIVLAGAVKQLYKRNCDQSDRISKIIEGNSIALHEHSEAIKSLTVLIKERGR